MKFQGKISNWQDGKGFGFVEPVGGGKRAFVHIKAFTAKSRRPANGEMIVYNLAIDNNKRYRAEKIKFLAECKSVNTQRKAKNETPLPMVFMYTFCAVMIWAVYSQQIPVAIAVVYLLMSLVAYAFYAFDKSAAENGRWRVKENTLHLLALMGGWPGALFGQNKLRHKSSKVEFKIVLWLTIVLNLIGLYYLLSVNGAYFLNHLVLLVDSLLMTIQPYFFI